MTRPKEFLREYEKLCEKYQIIVSGCGCCGSPFIYTISNDDYDYEPNFIEEHIKHLLEEFKEDIER